MNKKLKIKNFLYKISAGLLASVISLSQPLYSYASTGESLADIISTQNNQSTPDPSLNDGQTETLESASKSSGVLESVSNAEKSSQNVSQLLDTKLSASVGSYKITVEGLMPNGTKLQAERILNSDIKELEEKINQETYVDDYKIDVAFDIELLLNGQPWQPADNNSQVTVSIKNLDSDLVESDDFKVFRILDEEDIDQIKEETGISNVEAVTEVTVSEISDDSVCFDADHFTIYTVGGKTITVDGTAAFIQNINTFNGSIKKLVNSSATYSTTDTTIVSIEWSDDASIATDANKINIADATGEPIYAIKTQNADNEVIIKCYTTASKVFLIAGQNLFSSFIAMKTCPFVNDERIDTSNATNMSDMFKYCRSLTTLDLSGWDVSSVTNMSNMFYRCDKLTTLDLSNWDTSNVTNMSNMFYDCNNLITIGNLSDWNVSNVINMNSMFSECHALTTLDLSGWDMSNSNVTNIQEMFYGCRKLTTLDLSNFDTSNVTDMNAMFSGCSSLTSLNVSNFDTSNVTDMSAMFNHCSSLTSLNVSNFDTSKATTIDFMFNDCQSLTSLDISGFDTSILTIDANKSEYGAFCFVTGCSSLGYLHMFDTSKLSEEVVNNNTYGLNNNSPLQQNLPIQHMHLDDDHNYIPDSDITYSKFIIDTEEGNCHTYIKPVTLLEGKEFNKKLKTLIAQKDTSYLDEDRRIKFIKWSNTAFDTTSDPDAVIVSDSTSPIPVYAKKVTNNGNIGIELYTDTPLVYLNSDCRHMFYNMTALEEPTFLLSKINTSKATNMESMFHYCKSLTSLDLSNWDTSKVTDMSYMFSDCKKLTILNISSFDVSKVTRMNWFIGTSSHSFDYLHMFDTSKLSETVVNNEYGIVNKFSFNPSIYLDDDHNYIPDSDTAYSKLIIDTEEGNCHTYIKPTILLDGKRFNDRLKTLTSDISFIRWSNTAFDTVSDPDAIIVSTGYPSVYAKKSIDNGNIGIELYTNAATVPLNTNCSEMFCDMIALKEIPVFLSNKIDTSKATDMSAMFSGCSSLESLDLSNFDTSNVTNMSYMFGNCTSLETVDITNLNVSNIRDASSMFKNCTSLKIIDVFDTSTILVDATLDIFPDGHFCLDDNKDGIIDSQIEQTSLIKDTAAGTHHRYIKTYAVEFYDDYTEVSGIKYSHTSNINDNGIANFADEGSEDSYDDGRQPYGTDLYEPNTITIEGAESLHIKLTYATEESYDFIDIYQGDEYGKHLATYSGGADGNGVFPETAEFDIDGNTVTFIFNSDESISYYGYYAIVTANPLFSEYSKEYLIADGTHTITKPASDPHKDGYNFNGWYTIKENTEYDFNSPVTSDLKLVAKFSGIETTLISGGDFNIAIKNLTYSNVTNGRIFTNNGISSEGYLFSESGDTTGESITDSFTYDILWTNEDLSSDPNAINLATSGEPVYAVSATDTDNNYIIKLYTEADVVYLNEDSSNMLSVMTNLNYAHFLEDDRIDTSLVTNLTNLFGGWFSAGQYAITVCTATKLKTVDLSNWDTSEVTDMHCMFASCEQLTSANVSSFDVSNVVNMSSIFYGCKNLEDLNVSSWRPSNATDASSIFFSCEKLAQIDISEWNPQKLRDISYAFQDCNSITSLDMSSWDSVKIQDFRQTFCSCPNLQEIRGIGNLDMSSCRYWQGTFSLCSEIESLDLSGWGPISGNMQNMFGSCYKLTNLKIIIKPTDASKMFEWDNKLASLDTTGWDMSNCTDISSMFYQCLNLRELDVSDWDVSHVNKMTGTFYYCINLRELDVSNWNVSKVTKMGCAFNACGVKELNISQWTPSLAYYSGYSSPEYGYSSIFEAISVSELDFTNWTCFLNRTDMSSRDNLQNTFNSQAIKKIKNLAVSVNYRGDDIRLSEKYYLDDNNDGEPDSLTPVTKIINDGQPHTYIQYKTAATFLPGQQFNVKIKNLTVDDNRYTSAYYTSLGIDNPIDVVETTITNIVWSDDDSIVSDASAANVAASDSIPIYAILGSDDDGKVIVKLYTEAEEVFLAESSEHMLSCFMGLEYASFLEDEKINTSRTKNLSDFFCCSVSYNSTSRSVTSRSDDMVYSSLKSLDLRNWDVSAVVNLGEMFYGCTELEELHVETWRSPLNTTLDETFRDCKSLTTLNISDWDTSSVVYLNNTFQGCRSLTSLDLNSWNTSNVTRLDYAFTTCSSLTELHIEDWDVSKVRNMTQTFCGSDDGSATALTSLDISKWNIDNVTNMNWCFQRQKALVELKLPDFTNVQLSGQFAASYMFGECNALTSINVDYLCKSCTGGLQGIFSNCYALESVDISTWDTSNVVSMSNMFSNCHKLESITGIADINTSSSTDLNSMFSSCDKLSSLDLTAWDISKVANMFGMFMFCENLTTLDLTGWETDSAQGTAFNTMFRGCKKLKTIDVANWNLSGATDLALMFSDCNALEFVDVSRWDTSNVTTMYMTFLNCSSLTSLDVSGWDTGNVKNMGQMFYGCSSLESLDVSTWNTSSLTSANSMFRCSAKTLGDLSTKIVNEGQPNEYTAWDVSNINYTADSKQTINLMFCNAGVRKLDLTGWDLTRTAETIPSDAGYNYTLQNSFMSSYIAQIKNLAIPTSYTSSYGAKLAGGYYLDDNNDGIPDSDTPVTSIIIDGQPHSYIKTHTVTFNNNRHSNTDLSTAAIVRDESVTEYGKYIEHVIATGEDKAIAPVDPVATGSTFEGWFKAGSDEPFDFDTPITEDIVLTARFSGFDTTFKAGQLFNMDIKGLVDDSLDLYTSASGTEPYDDVYENTITDIVWSDDDSIAADPAAINVAADGCAPIYAILSTNEAGEVVVKLYTAMDMVYLNADCDWMLGNFGALKHASFLEDERINTSRMTSASDMFASYVRYNSGSYYSALYGYKTSLESLDLSKWNTANLIYGSEMFAGCEKLTTLNVSTWDVTELQYANNMFRECFVLENFNIDNWNPQNLYDIQYMFQTCRKIESLDLHSWDVSGVREARDMFAGCKELKTLNITGWQFTNVRDLQELFYGCEKLETLNVDGLVTSQTTEITAIFNDCLKLRTISANNWDVSNVKRMRAAFNNCKNLENVDFVADWVCQPTEMYVLFSNCSKVTNIDISGIDLSKAGSLMTLCNGCTALTSVTFSDTPTPAMTSCNSAFSFCSNLVTLDISHWTTESLTDCTSMFSFDSKLEYVDFSPEWNMTNVKKIGRMFQYCDVLEPEVLFNELNFPNWDTSEKTEMDGFLRSCAAKEDAVLDLTGWDISKVQKMEEFLSGTAASSGSYSMRARSVDVTGLDYSGLTYSQYNTALYNAFKNSFNGRLIGLCVPANYDELATAGNLNVGPQESKGAVLLTYSSVNKEVYLDDDLDGIADDGVARYLAINDGQAHNYMYVNHTVTFNNNPFSNTNLAKTGVVKNTSVTDHNQYVERIYKYDDEENIYVIQPADPEVPFESASFLGWYEDEATQPFNFSEPIHRDVVLTAKFSGMPPILLPGQEFNVQLKTLAKSYREGSYEYSYNSDGSVRFTDESLSLYSDTDNKIETIEWVTPGYLETMKETGTVRDHFVRVSEDNGGTYVYAYVGNPGGGTLVPTKVYLCTSYVGQAYANTDCRDMFAGFTKLDASDVLNGIDMSYISNTTEMFKGTATTTADLSQAYNLNNTADMFKNCDNLYRFKMPATNALENSISDFTMPEDFYADVDEDGTPDDTSAPLTNLVNTGDDVGVYTRFFTATFAKEEPTDGDAQYSHTTNISDDGTRSGDYPSSQSTKDTVTVEGSTALHVVLTYGTENNWDWMAVMKGTYSGTVPSSKFDGISAIKNDPNYIAGYTDKKDAPVTVEFDVEGDTVTFLFRSDSSVQGYGYYAVVTGNAPASLDDSATIYKKDFVVGDGVSSTTPPEDPTDSNGIFAGWVRTDGEYPSSEDFYLITKNTVYVAQWDEPPAVITNAPAAEHRFTLIAKQLADPSITDINAIDNKITEIYFVDSPWENIESSINIAESGKVYARFVEKPFISYDWPSDAEPGEYIGHIELYSPSSTIYLENITGLYKNMKMLSTTRIFNNPAVNTSRVTNVNSLFEGCSMYGCGIYNEQLDNSVFENITSASNTFKGTKISSSDYIKNWNLVACEDRCDSMFENCSELSSFDLGNLEYISDRMFYGCTKLTSFQHGENVCHPIGENAFYVDPVNFSTTAQSYNVIAVTGSLRTHFSQYEDFTSMEWLRYDWEGDNRNATEYEFSLPIDNSNWQFANPINLGNINSNDFLELNLNFTIRQYVQLTDIKAYTLPYFNLISENNLSISDIPVGTILGKSPTNDEYSADAIYVFSEDPLEYIFFRDTMVLTFGKLYATQYGQLTNTDVNEELLCRYLNDDFCVDSYENPQFKFKSTTTSANKELRIVGASSYDDHDEQTYTYCVAALHDSENLWRVFMLGNWAGKTIDETMDLMESFCEEFPGTYDQLILTPSTNIINTPLREIPNMNQYIPNTPKNVGIDHNFALDDLISDGSVHIDIDDIDVNEAANKYYIDKKYTLNKLYIHPSSTFSPGKIKGTIPIDIRMSGYAYGNINVQKHYSN